MVSESSANDKRLRSGALSLSQLYSEAGQDFAEVLPAMASDYGVSEPEMRALLKSAIFNAQGQQASMINTEVASE